MSVIALIGYRGSGKSTVARRLAEELAWPWIDADLELERRAGKSIAALFADDGEQAFRDLEVRVVADVCRGGPHVAALGGGAVLRPENRGALRACRQVVWLRAPVDVLMQRIAGDPATSQRRPDLTASGGRREVEQLLEFRTPFYRECATLEVDTEGKGLDQIVTEILNAS